MDYWGYHLMLDVKGCEIQRATDPEYIKHFTKDLVRLIEMVPYGEPQLVHFADNTEKAGWTVIQLIETSNIMGHFLDINGDLYMDIFSCKDFEEARVVKALEEHFKPEKIKSRFFRRQA
jgi:S-adenosylmethionine/arginine decarboxylase-like enzyme